MSVTHEDRVPVMDGASQEASWSWKNFSTLEDAKHLIDTGTLLTWREYKQVHKVLSISDLKELVQYSAQILAERVESRLPEEILIETLLIIFANVQEEEISLLFLQELLQQPNWIEACQVLVELSITAEISNAEFAEQIFSVAVVMICELGTMIRNQSQITVQSCRLLDHISTYLLSVSNSNDNCVRLSLLHYFGSSEKGKVNKSGFNRIMGRFGHTVLEHLFSLLFNKKTEAVSLQFLLENIPYILEADDHAQTILQETWKHYLLKRPERFALFVQALTQYLSQMPDEEARICRKKYLQHLALLLKKVAEVDHKELGREILAAIATFRREPFFPELIKIILRDTTIRDSFRALVVKMAEGKEMDAVLEGADAFKSSKRGRKPSFARAAKTPIIYQVKFLGQHPVAKAS